MIGGLFDLFFQPFRAINPAYGLAAIAVVIGVVAMLVFRFASNQQAMRRIKNRTHAHVLEVRLFPDQLSVVLRAYARIVRFTVIYLAYALKPAAILFLPMVIVLSQLNLRFSRVPLRPGESFILNATLTQPLTPGSDSLRLPPGLTLTAPPVHLPTRREVDWRIRADRKGDFSPAVVVADRAFVKRVAVSSDLTRLYVKRERGSVWNWVSNPGEPPLPERGPIQDIKVSYAPRAIDVGSFAINWLVFFLVVAVASGLVVKILLRVEL